MPTHTPSSCDVTISDHAVQRYIERARPALDHSSAARDLEQLRHAGTITDRPPFGGEGPGPDNAFYLVIGGVYVLPLSPCQGRWLATTLLTAQSSQEHTDRRRAAKATRRTRDAERGRRASRQGARRAGAHA